jgi:putative heme transporter
MTAASPPRVAPSKGAWRGILIPVAVLAIVFGLVLPRIIDYGAVAAAIGLLTPGQLLGLAAAAALAYVVNAAPNKLLVRELTWPQAVGADIAGRAVASTIPGPTDIASRMLLYTQWGIRLENATAGLVIGGLVETGSSLVLPLIALLSILVAGSAVSQLIVFLAVGGAVVLAIAVLAFSGIVRSERIARSIGEVLERIARHLFGLLDRHPPEDIVEAILDLRSRLQFLATRSGLSAYVAAVGAKLAWFLVLEVALWACGVGPSVLPAGAVLTAMAVVGIVALVPLTPGGVGVSEITYLAILTALVDPSLAVSVGAAVFLFRIVQWLIPIPLGWILFVIMRRGHGLFTDEA